MRRSGWQRTGCAGLLGVLAACSVTEVSKTELAEVVERDGVAFEGVDIPGSVVRRLASNRLVIIGETHLIREHGRFLIGLLDSGAGPSIVLGVTAAEIVSASGSTVPDWSVLDASPDNEIWRLMHEAWPEHTVFLPLDDPVFLDGVQMNFEGVIHTGAPKRHYDVFLMYPVAHRIPL